MKELEYKKIKSQKQYEEYCETLRDLLLSEEDTDEIQDHIELLMVLIDQWDSEQYDGSEFDPVELIQSLKKDHGLAQKDLAKIAGVSTSYMSEMLNYKKHLSKSVIRRLADHFKISQKALNKPYKLRKPDFSYSEMLIENVFLQPSQLTRRKKRVSPRSTFETETALISKSFSSVNIKAEC